MVVMFVTLDQDGGIRLPEEIREALGIQPGDLLEIQVRDGRVEITVVRREVGLERRGPFLVAVPEGDEPVVSADAVRRVIEEIREERLERLAR